MSKKVAVIGSGFGGLGIALRLQAKGYDVEIFEKNANETWQAFWHLQSPE